MALGADTALPSSTKSPLRSPSVPKFGAPPPRVNDGAVADMRNNFLAGAAGAGRMAMQGMDRAGVSRGRGQQLRSDMAQAGADVEASTNAARVDMDAANANARAQQAFETTMKGEQLGNQSLLEGLRMSGMRERFAKQGWQQDLNEAMRRGQFGLDSMYLDPGQLVQWMFRS